MFLFEGIAHSKMSTLKSSAHDSEPFRSPILVPRWSGVVHVLPTSVVGGSKSRPCTFHLVPGSCTMSTTEWRRVDRIGDIQEVEG